MHVGNYKYYQHFHFMCNGQFRAVLALTSLLMQVFLWIHSLLMIIDFFVFSVEAVL